MENPWLFLNHLRFLFNSSLEITELLSYLNNSKLDYEFIMSSAHRWSKCIDLLEKSMESSKKKLQMHLSTYGEAET